MVGERIRKGDTVRHLQWPEYGLGKASFADKMGRWVVWNRRGARWGAGVYSELDLAFVEGPESSQIRLNL